jgi:predicted nucleic acid-binding protein
VILVDTSVWVRHLRYLDETLTEQLNAEEVLAHPFVIGELALGNLRQRDLVLSSLQELPQASVASHEEVLQLIHAGALFGTGIGYVDAHLLASARLAVGATLWTRDKRLQAAASKLRLEWRGASERSRYG